VETDLQAGANHRFEVSQIKRKKKKESLLNIILKSIES
jgi:hypothetical protein